MRQLDRKLLRDLWQMKSQVAAIVLVIASGMAMFVMTSSMLRSLSFSQQAYYERYRFAHVFARLKRAPQVLAEQIGQIPGVASVQTRVVVDISLDVAGLVEPATGRLISVPDQRRKMLNDVYLRRGRYIDADRAGEVLVGEAFADAHQLALGDKVTAVINGHQRALTIVGVVLSPEYVLQISGATLFPDDKRFGVFWMSETELSAAFDMQGAFNDVTLQLMRGASEAGVIARLDQLIEPYGGIGAYGRDDQTSHRYLEDEMRGLRVNAVIVPSLFMAVAAFLLNVVLSRLVATQRQQIAVLKAFGYSRYEVGLHYFKLTICIALAGSLVGGAAGVWLGRGIADLYTRFYRFPTLFFRFDLGVALTGTLITISAAVLGASAAVRRAAWLPPAEAMRPEVPGKFRPTWVERLGLGPLLPQTTRMVLRHLERRPLKSLLSVLGIALATSILVTGSFMEDALDYLIQHEFYRTQHQHMTVRFVEPAPRRAYYDLMHLPGVIYAEPTRSIPARLRSGHHSRRVGIEGIAPASRLRELLDVDQRPVSVPPGGIALSRKLANVLAIGRGESLTLEVLEGERVVRQVPVMRIIDDYSGMNAYMHLPTMHRLLREGDVLTGAHLLIDELKSDELYDRLKSTPRIAGVFDRKATIRGFEETISENLLQMRVYNIVFACIIAVGVVYNTARISLSERSRELASLRVMGFTRAEISSVLLGELAILTVAALPLGCLLGFGFAALTTWGFDTELYRIPLVVERSTYVFAATITLLASAGSAWIVRRRLDRLDLVAVLKSQE